MILAASMAAAWEGFVMKIFYCIIFLVYAAAELCILVQLKRKRQKTGLRATAFSFGFMILLTLAVFLFGLNISYFLMILSLVSVFLDSYVGYYQDLYKKSRATDRWLHAYGTFALALLFYDIIRILVKEGGSKAFRALFVLLLGVALGAAHEIMEFIADIRLNSHMQKGLRDTNLDSIFNILGAVAAAAAAYFFIA